MNPFDAYKRHQNATMPRIELTLGLYRKAIESLEKAREALTQQNADAARSYLLKTQLIVTSLSAELPAYRDEAATNFMRLYEFVAHQMTLESIEAIDASLKVLRPLLEGFESVREQALTMERTGQIAALDQVHQISVNV
jgi:flagellin-specific chaperone FliS